MGRRLRVGSLKYRPKKYTLAPYINYTFIKCGVRGAERRRQLHYPFDGIADNEIPVSSFNYGFNSQLCEGGGGWSGGELTTRAPGMHGIEQRAVAGASPARWPRSDQIPGVLPY